MFKKILNKVLILALLLNVVWADRANAQSALGVGLSNTIFNATATVTSGTSYAVPSARAMILTWVVDYASAPASITLAIQGSNNNVAWFDLATTSSTSDVGGNIGPTSIKFVRVNISAVAGGTGTSVTIVPQGFNNPAVYTGGVLSTSLLIADGTGAAPSLAFASSPTWGISKSSTWGIAFGIGAQQLAVDSLGPVMGSGASLRWAVDSLVNTSAYDIKLARTGAKILTMDDGVGGAASFTTTGSFNAGASGNVAWSGRTILRSLGTGLLRALNNAESRSLDFQAVDTPTCTTSCGTSPTASGVGSSFDIVMGASGVPASPFTITFATAWAAAPQCVASMGTTGMVVGKLPLTIVTTTTTAVIVTNGTAPAVNDRYHFKCSLGQ